MKLIFAALMFISLASTAQKLSSTAKKTASTTQKKDSSYTFSGNFTEVKTGKIYLVRFYPDKTVIDSTSLVNGGFQFKGFVSEPVTTILTFQKKNFSNFYRFLLESAKMTVNGKGDTLSKLLVKGSKLNDENYELSKMLKPASDWEKQNDSLYEIAAKEKNKAVLDSLDKFDKPVLEMKRKVVAAFVKTHPASPVSALAIQQNFAYYAEASDVEPLYNQLSPALKQSTTGKDIKKLMEGYRVVAVGKTVPEIAQADTSGNTEKLSSLRGHYVLLDFWASWCGPCRAENPNIVKAYSIYHDKGLEIFAVSYDVKNGHAKWVKAINDDHLTWHQVSELAGWQNTTSDQFSIKSIPSNMLLDKNGKIIAKNLFGDELTAKLKELMPE